MSRNKLYTMPHMTESLKKKLEFEKLEMNFKYRDDRGEHFLEIEHPAGYSSTSKKLVDSQKLWSYEKNGVIIELKCQLKHPEILFGKNGLVPQDSEIGVAIMYTSADSGNRGSIKMGTFTYDKCTDELTYETETLLKKGIFREKVTFTVILYISRSGHPEIGERHLANEAGYRLGELDSFTLVLDGQNLCFTVLEQNMGDDPLWQLRLDWTEAEYDSFVDTVALIINKESPAYKALDLRYNKYADQLLAEIMSQCLYMVIERFKAEGNNFDKDKSYQEGSVSHVVNYFYYRIGCERLNSTSMSFEIRKFFEKNL